MGHTLVCWKCGASLAELTLPLRRLEECLACHAELHVCRMCEWYSAAVAKQCREPVTEEVKEKERANFCDYFQPRAHAYRPTSDTAARARHELEALFGKRGDGGAVGAQPDPAASARAQLDELFRPK